MGAAVAPAGDVVEFLVAGSEMLSERIQTDFAAAAAATGKRQNKTLGSCREGDRHAAMQRY
jgi:hypothetical protein